MLSNYGTTTIKTKRLLLRKFKLDDALSFYKNVGNDPKVSKYVVWNRHENLDVTKKVISSWIRNYKNDYTYFWAVELKDTNEVIGSISCVNVDTKNFTCELGYVYGSKFWNKGYGTETLTSVIDYLMNTEGFNTIYAMHLSLNPASGKVMEKSGMEFEGRLKKRMIDKNTGKYDDLISYSISKN